MKGNDRIGKETKGKGRRGNQRSLSFSSFLFLLFPFLVFLFFLSFLEEQRRRKRRERNGKFPFLSKEKPPDRVPRRSFGNLKGGGPRGAPG